MVISAATAMATSTSITIKPIISISKIPKEPGSVSPEAEGKGSRWRWKWWKQWAKRKLRACYPCRRLLPTLIILETISDGSELPSTGT